jgi:hypothetical protein
VTIVTIIKESPRATGRGNNSDRYYNKNKDKKQWQLGCESGDGRLNLTENNMIAPCIGHYYRGKYPD